MQEQNYISSIFQDYLSDNEMAAVVSGRNYIQKMLAFESALAKCQAQLNIIPIKAANEIVQIISNIEIQADQLAEGSLKNGIPTIALLHLVKTKLSDESKGYLHFGVTSQDVMDTAFTLMMKESTEILEKKLSNVIRAFGVQLSKHQAITIVGRTRTQHAVPLTLGIKISNWLNPLINQLEKLQKVKSNILKIQLGGAVGSLSVMKAQGHQLSELLAKELGLEKSFPWHNDGSIIASFTNWLTVVSASTAKIAKDILTLSQTEIGEVVENKSGGGKSSTMPHKNNPILSEAIVALANQNIHLNAASQSSMINANERDAVAWMAEWLSIPDLLTNTGAILNHAITIAKNIEFRLGKINSNLESLNGLVYSEAASFELFNFYSRAEAKNKVGEACSIVLEKNIHLKEALKEVCSQSIDWNKVFDAANQKGISDDLVDYTLKRIEKIQ